jgi:MFS superfamily sulfate permease-like transporter
LDIPTFLQGANTPVTVVSVSTLVMLFALSSLQKRIAILKVIPPQLLAVVFGVIMAVIFQLKQVNPGFLISLPEKPFSTITSPDFSGLIARPELWYAAIMGVITLTMIDGVESLATAMAVDRLDPYRRRSNPDRVLLAMGISNIASSLIGGLTIIPGGVKSKANIASGGRTLWANFTNAICLLVYLLLARDLIMMIPKGALAAVLIFTGWKMCEPMIWRHVAKIGKEQLAIFTFTIIATLATDLLWGIVAGTLMTLAMNTILYRFALIATIKDVRHLPSVLSSITSFFKSPVTSHEIRSSEYRLVLERPLVCFNSYLLSEELNRIPSNIKKVVIDVGHNSGIVDHTGCENLMFEVEESSCIDRQISVEGLHDMSKLSKHHKTCTHICLT